MSYTKKQQIYAKYMLKQIGMSNEDFIEGYLKHLEVLYAEMIPEQNKTTGWVSWKHTVNNCIERLKEEIQLKKNRHNIKYKKLTDKIAATDLANYIYCPVSYSISKTFEIETFGNGINLAALGQNFHEQVRLINRFTNKEDENLATNHEYYNIYNNEIIRKIKSSKPVFIGHSDRNNNFTNNSEKFIGSPDYIFIDEDKNFFVVEEKFHKKRDPSHGGSDFEYEAVDIGEEWENADTFFYKNHQVQLISYIRNIREYNLKYGYLVYWYYDIQDNKPYIHKIAIKKIVVDERLELLYQTAKNGIEHLIANNNIVFDIASLNAKKCAGCAVSQYCGHKNSRFNNLKFPYNINDISLHRVEFPEELKRVEQSTTNVRDNNYRDNIVINNIEEYMNNLEQNRQIDKEDIPFPTEEPLW